MRFSRLPRWLCVAAAGLIVSPGPFLVAQSSPNPSGFVPLRNDSTLFRSTIDDSWAWAWKKIVFLSPHDLSVNSSSRGWIVRRHPAGNTRDFYFLLLSTATHHKGGLFDFQSKHISMSCQQQNNNSFSSCSSLDYII